MSQTESSLASVPPPLLGYEPPREDWLADDRRGLQIIFNVGIAYLIAEVFARGVQQIEWYIHASSVPGNMSTRLIYACTTFGFAIALIVLILLRRNLLSLRVAKYLMAAMLLCVNVEFLELVLPLLFRLIAHRNLQTATAIASDLRLIAYRSSRLVAPVMLMLATAERLPPRRLIAHAVTVFTSLMGLSFAGLAFQNVANGTWNFDARDAIYVTSQSLFFVAAIFCMIAFRGERPKTPRSISIPIAILVFVGCAGSMIWTFSRPVRSLDDALDLTQAIAYLIRDSMTAIALLALTLKSPRSVISIPEISK